MVRAAPWLDDQARIPVSCGGVWRVCASFSSNGCATGVTSVNTGVNVPVIEWYYVNSYLVTRRIQMCIPYTCIALPSHTYTYTYKHVPHVHGARACGG